MSKFLKKLMLEKEIDDLNKVNKSLEKEIPILQKELKDFKEKLNGVKALYIKNYKEVMTKHERHTKLYDLARYPIKHKTPGFSMNEVLESLKIERETPTKLSTMNKKRLEVFKTTKQKKTALNSFSAESKTKAYLEFKEKLEKKIQEFKEKHEELKEKNVQFELNNEQILKKTEELLEIDPPVDLSELSFEEQMNRLELKLEGKKRKRTSHKRKSKRRSGKKNKKSKRRPTRRSRK